MGSKGQPDPAASQWPDLSGFINMLSYATREAQLTVHLEKLVVVATAD
jgi:hypothetical protein